MKLKDIREEVSFFSEKAGDVNQKLALAGIAIIWLFKETSGGKVVLDSYMVISLILFIMALGLALIQYSVFAPIYRHYYSKNMTRQVDGKTVYLEEEEEVGQPFKTNDLSWVFFFLKIASVIVGYIFLFFSILENFTF
jgi:hypothetical protein